MKTNLQCAKFSSNDIVKILGTTGAFGSGDNIMIGMTSISAIW